MKKPVDPTDIFNGQEQLLETEIPILKEVADFLGMPAEDLRICVERRTAPELSKLIEPYAQELEIQADDLAETLRTIFRTNLVAPEMDDDVN